MKKDFIFNLLCLLFISFSFNVHAQNECNIHGADIIIEEIIWDATTADLSDILAPQVHTTFTFNSGSISLGAIAGTGSMVATPVFIPHPTFHIVKISFERLPDFLHTLAFDIDVNITHDTDAPVYLVFDDGIYAGVYPHTNTNGEITGFLITPEADGGGGFTSTPAVMGRSAGYTYHANMDCVEIIATDRLASDGKGTCPLDDANFQECIAYAGDSNEGSGSRVNTTDTFTVNVYPNPVQDNLFIENNGLEINEISIMTLDGRIVNQNTSIRQGIDRTQINTSQLESGIYLLKLETPTDNIIKKIIVQ